MPLQLFSWALPVQKRGGRWNHVFGDVRKEYLNGFWGASSSFLCQKDCFHTRILLFHFPHKSRWSDLERFTSNLHISCFISFCIRFNESLEWSGKFYKANGSGWQARALWTKEMPSSGKPESGWIAIGSLAAQRAPGLMCGALLNTPLQLVDFMYWWTRSIFWRFSTKKYQGTGRSTFT